MTPLHHIQRTHISPVLGQGSREGSAWCSRCLLQKKRLTAQGGGTRSGRASADRGTSAERPGGKASLDQTACCLKPPGWPALSPPLTWCLFHLLNSQTPFPRSPQVKFYGYRTVLFMFTFSRVCVKCGFTGYRSQWESASSRSGDPWCSSG